MPRDGSGVYTQPFPDVVTSTTVSSTVFNGYVHDVSTDLNAPRPIVAGGTGATSAAAARTALVAETYGQVVTNYDSFPFLPGSFLSDGAATSPPVAGHAFVGTCDWADGNNMYLEAFDRDDSSQPGAMWIRQKKAGVWSSWAKAQALNVVGTPTANQFTTWQSSTAIQGVAITGLVKGNGASAPAAAVSGTDYAPATSGTSVLKGNGSGGFSNAAVGTDFAGVAANPTATIGLSTVNGTANTAMRSDGAPALSQAIVPTWSGQHTFNLSPVVPTPSVGDNTTKAASTAYVLANAATATPLADTSTGVVGTATKFAREDHAHPVSGRVLLATLTASNSATLFNTTAFTSTYSEYEIVFINLLPATNNVNAQLQVHSGGSFQATSYLTQTFGTAGSVTVNFSNSTTFIQLHHNNTILNTGAGLSGSVRLSIPSDTAAPKFWIGQSAFPTSTFIGSSVVTGMWNNNAALTGFQVQMSAGNITSGTIKIYGMT